MGDLLAQVQVRRIPRVLAPTTNDPTQVLNLELGLIKDLQTASGRVTGNFALPGKTTDREQSHHRLADFGTSISLYSPLDYTNKSKSHLLPFTNIGRPICIR